LKKKTSERLQRGYLSQQLIAREDIIKIVNNIQEGLKGKFELGISKSQ
jgi:hypothetical protein